MRDGKERSELGPGGGDGSLALLAVDGPLRGQRFPLSRGALAIGRAPTNDIVLRSADVLGSHARLVIDAGGCSVEDLASHGSTFIDDVAIAGPTPLELGSELRLGQENTLLVVQSDAADDGQPEKGARAARAKGAPTTEAPADQSTSQRVWLLVGMAVVAVGVGVALVFLT